MHKWLFLIIYSMYAYIKNSNRMRAANTRNRLNISLVLWFHAFGKISKIVRAFVFSFYRSAFWVSVPIHSCMQLIPDVWIYDKLNNICYVYFRNYYIWNFDDLRKLIFHQLLMCCTTLDFDPNGRVHLLELLQNN